MNAEERREVSDNATLTKEMRKEIKETFTSLEKVLSQPDFVENMVKAFEFMNLLAKAKDCLHLLDEKLEIPRDEDFRFDIAKVVEAIENCQSEIRQGRDGDEWLKTARERIRGVNDRLKGW